MLDTLIAYWERSHYTNACSLFMAVLGLMVAFSKRRQFQSLRYFPLYFIGYIGVSVVNMFDVLTLHRYRPAALYLSYLSDLAFTLFEYFILLSFIKEIFLRERNRRIVNLLYLGFILSMGVLWGYLLVNQRPISQYFMQYTFTLQATFLIIPCVLYFIELFQNEPRINLVNEPAFWVVTGITFFMVCTLPYSYLSHYLIRNNYALYSQMFSIFDLFYCLLFLMIIRAYRCKPEQKRLIAIN